MEQRQGSEEEDKKEESGDKEGGSKDGPRESQEKGTPLSAVVDSKPQSWSRN